MNVQRVTFFVLLLEEENELWNVSFLLKNVFKQICLNIPFMLLVRQTDSPAPKLMP